MVFVSKLLLVMVSCNMGANNTITTASSSSLGAPHEFFKLEILVLYSEGFCVARLLHYDNRETPLAGNFVGRCQGHKSDVSTQSWVLISEKDNVTISGRCLYTHEWRELVTGGEVGNGMEKIMAIII